MIKYRTSFNVRPQLFKKRRCNSVCIYLYLSAVVQSQVLYNWWRCGEHNRAVGCTDGTGDTAVVISLFLLALSSLLTPLTQQRLRLLNQGRCTRNVHLERRDALCQVITTRTAFTWRRDQNRKTPHIIIWMSRNLVSWNPVTPSPRDFCLRKKGFLGEDS